MKPKQLLPIFGLLLLLSACGNKGPVRPLDIPIPGPVSDVELRQQGESLLLGWQLPGKNQDGSPLKMAPKLDIYRMTVDPEDDCPECTDRSTLLVSIDPELPAPARRVEADRYLFADHNLVVGKGYRYKLIPRTVAGAVGQPLILRQTYQQPVAAPEHLQASARDRSALLTWQAFIPASGETLLGYQLYRRRAGEEPAPYPLNSKPLQQFRYEDFSLENGTRYLYRVRALVKREGQVLEGIASAEVTVIPKSGI